MLSRCQLKRNHYFSDARCLTAILAVLAILTIRSPVATAEVTSLGDVSPTISDAGGDVGGDLTIGVTGVAGLFMDIAPPLSGVLTPLVSENGIIGDGIAAIGAASFNDFGVEWNIGNKLTVGKAGQGFLDLSDSAAVTAGILVVVGEESTGLGVITLTGPASRVDTVDLTVGDLGIGTIELSNRGSIDSNSGTSIIGSQDGSNGTVSLTDLGTRWTVGSLTIGNSVSAQGKLKIASQALVQASGTTTVDLRGTIDLLGGTFRDLSGTDISNSGLVRGNGFLDASMTLNATGELRNFGQAGNYPPEEALLISGVVISDGTIESLGGEMEFQAAVTNTREIIARDAVMRFDAGVDNMGSFSIGGNTTIHGNVINNGGRMTVLSDSASTLVGDLTFSAGILELAVGTAPGTFDITGSADLTGAVFGLTYSAGILAQAGDTYQIFQAGGGISSFSTTTASDGTNLWDITQSGNKLFATFSGISANPVGADFNGDGIVDALDLSIWGANIGSMGTPPIPGDADGDGDVDGLDFLKIQRDLGGAPSPLLAVTAGTVPEPSAAILLLLGSVLIAGRRSRNVS